MGNSLESFAFMKIKPSYEINDPNIKYITRKNSSSLNIPVKEYIVDLDKPTILFCHGNGCDIGSVDLEDFHASSGCNIITFDYAGYGHHSKRIPSEKDCYEDVSEVFLYAYQTLEVPLEKLIIMGHSLGSAPACYLAYKLSKLSFGFQGSLVLLSPLSSGFKIFSLGSWFGWTGDIFTNYKLAPKITCKSIVIHGDQDEVIPWKCGKEVSELLPRNVKFILLKGKGHNINLREIGLKKIIREHL